MVQVPTKPVDQVDLEAEDHLLEVKVTQTNHHQQVVQVEVIMEIMVQ